MLLTSIGDLKRLITMGAEAMGMVVYSIFSKG